MIKQSDGSVAKAEGSLGKLFVLGMLAGAFIALGAQASLMASFNLTSDPETFGIGKVVMGAVFPVGLMMVVLCGAELFTGNCLMIIGALDKKIRVSAMLRNWAIVYLGNLHSISIDARDLACLIGSNDRRMTRQSLFSRSTRHSRIAFSTRFALQGCQPLLFCA